MPTKFKKADFCDLALKKPI